MLNTGTEAKITDWIHDKLRVNKDKPSSLEVKLKQLFKTDSGWHKYSGKIQLGEKYLTGSTSQADEAEDFTNCRCPCMSVVI